MKSRIFTHSLAALVVLALLLSLAGMAQADIVGPCGPYVTQVGNVFTVTPNGSDDTANLQCALDAAAAVGPGSTVQLAAGLFHSGFVYEGMYNGTIKGMGMDKTVIESLPDLPCDDPTFSPDLWAFNTAKLRIADLSFHIADETPCDVENPNSVGHAIGVISIDGTQPMEEDKCLPFSTDPIDIRVDSVSIRGENGDFYAWGGDTTFSSNVTNGIGIWDYCNDTPAGIQTWSAKITRSRFEHLGVSLEGGWLKGMRFEAGGSPSQGNFFNASTLSPFWVLHNRNFVADVSYNEMRNNHGTGFFTFSDGMTELSTYKVHHNTISAMGEGNGAYVDDDSFLNGTPSLSVSITQNHFILDGADVWGIAALDGKDFLFADNRFSGFANIGILAGQFGYEGDPLVSASHFLIKGNNLNKLNYTQAPIYLSNTSANCTVVGKSNKDYVEDHGTNNVIVRAIRHSSSSIGTSVSEMMKLKADISKMIKRGR